MPRRPAATVTPSLAEQVARQSWYHTLELAPGIVTPGHFDTRPAAAKVPLPERLEGLRCLDVGTWDGFWAFELERRGAASVTAIDIDDPRRWDWPPQARRRLEADVRYLDWVKSAGAGFHLAHEALGSQVERVDLSVYDLSPERVGTFDVAFLGSLLLHLRDPVRALDALRSVTTGFAVIADTIELVPTLLRPRTPTARLEGLEQSWWWQPNAAGLFRMVESAGWRIETRTRPYLVPLGASHPRPPLRQAWRGLLSASGRERIITRLAGIPHVAVRAIPGPA